MGHFGLGDVGLRGARSEAYQMWIRGGGCLRDVWRHDGFDVSPIDPKHQDGFDWSSGFTVQSRHDLRGATMIPMQMTLDLSLSGATSYSA